ncbi:voltage-dependent anion channel-domain-containing protein [Xylariaceae sp. FL1019]|nr:voltage-dependent anion channel-domain-containing protein [Xylariaceae sp. FL1019]
MPRASASQVDIETAENGYRTPRERDFFNRRSLSPAMSHQQSRETNTLDPFSDATNDARNQEFGPGSLARMISVARKETARGGKIGLRDRICCFQWTYFTSTMATGGVANVLYSLSKMYAANWLWYIGVIFFLLNMILFVINCVLITMRFAMVPGSFMHSFLDQTESLFIPAVVVSFATILINICQYGVPHTGLWLLKTIEVFFWIYTVISVVTSAGMYLILWSTQIFPVHQMTPVWVFPGYPLLLTAPYAANLISVDTAGTGEINRLPIAVAAVTLQGTGFLISFMICAAFIYRLMTQKLPRDMQRPGVFISIGPPAFTVAGLVLLGQQTASILPPSYAGEPHAVFILELLSTILGLWLWGLSEWFFIVSVGSLIKYARGARKIPFQMTWWSFVFPNTALVTATLALAEALDSNGLRLYASVFTGVLVLVWTVIFTVMVKCIWKRQLLWPKDLERE